MRPPVRSPWRPEALAAALGVLCVAGCLTLPDPRPKPDGATDADAGPSPDADAGPSPDADAGPDGGPVDADGGPSRDGGPTFPPSGVIVREAVVADLDGDGRDDLVAIDAAAQHLYVLYGRGTDFARHYDLRLDTAMHAGAIHIADLVGPSGVGADGAPDLFIAGELGGTPIVQGFQGPRFDVAYSKSASGPDLGDLTKALPVYLSSGHFRAGRPSLVFGGEFRVVLLALDAWTRTGFADMTQQYLPADGIFTVSHNAVARASTSGGLDDLLVVSEYNVRWYPNPGDGAFVGQTTWVDFFHEQTRVVRFPDLPVQGSGVDGCTDFVGARLGNVFAFELPCDRVAQPDGPFDPEIPFQDDLVDLHVVDLDSSGRPELVSLRRDGNDTRLAVWRDLSLNPPARLERVRPDATTLVPGAPRFALVGDFDGDGDREIVLLDDGEAAPLCYTLTAGNTLAACAQW